MKRIAVLLFAVAVAIAGVSASGAPEGSELSLGLGYDYDLYGATGIHGLGINMYCQQPVAESADLYWNIDIMVPFQVIALGTSVGRDAYDTLFGMGVSFGGGKAFMVGDNVRMFIGGGAYWKWIAGYAYAGGGMNSMVGIEGNFTCSFIVNPHIVVDIGARIGTPLLAIMESDGVTVAQGVGGINISPRVAVGYRF